METIKGWAALIAATSIVGAVFLALIPGGKAKAAFSTLVGIVFICAIISPFSAKSDLNFDFEDDFFALTEKNEEYLNQSSKAAISVAQSGFENALKTAFENLGYSDFQTAVECDENLKVEVVTVVFKTDFDQEKVKSEIKRICGDTAIKLSKGESDER